MVRVGEDRMQHWVLSMMFQTFVSENNRAKAYLKEKNSQMTQDTPSPIERKKVIVAHIGQ